MQAWASVGAFRLSLFIFVYVEQDALMPPNLCRKLDDPAAMCVCCLVVFDFLIHSSF